MRLKYEERKYKSSTGCIFGGIQFSRQRAHYSMTNASYKIIVEKFWKFMSKVKIPIWNENNNEEYRFPHNLKKKMLSCIANLIYY